MRSLVGATSGPTDRDECGCRPAFDGDRLVVDAADCPGRGALEREPGCRETVIERLETRDAEAVSTTAAGRERAYEGDAAGLLTAAGRFADAVAFHDERLAARARRDPIGAARVATGRAGPAARLASESGLAAATRSANGYATCLQPAIGPTVSRARLSPCPPRNGTFESRRELDTGGVARLYTLPASERRRYHLEPVEHRLDRSATATLASAYELLASGAVSGGDRAPGRAVRRAADPDADVSTIETVLAKHTVGHGVLADLFADDRVSDVFVTAPAPDNRVRVRVDGETMTTNVSLTGEGVDALASRFRRESGRAFSRANPTLDATAEVRGRRVRVAGVTDPVSDGVAFAFRAQDRTAWTLPALVANGTVSAEAAGFLSVAVERAAATLVAGTRGAGKTTLLSALLWELSAATRTVAIEDTPELPVARLQADGRDVQRLRTGDERDAGLPPAEALRTALRLGEGALVVGEVRGEEAAVLYEAMRVGANGSAVLGTIHGDSGADVRERVVTDLGVPDSSFRSTDLVVTLEPYDSPSGRGRRVKRIEEVLADADETEFASLYTLEDGALVSTGRIERGNSHLVQSLTGPTEDFADVTTLVSDRAGWLRSLVKAGKTRADAVSRAHANRRSAGGTSTGGADQHEQQGDR